MHLASSYPEKKCLQAHAALLRQEKEELVCQLDAERAGSAAIRCMVCHAHTAVPSSAAQGLTDASFDGRSHAAAKSSPAHV